MTRIGIISDTHGYLNPAVQPIFEGSDLIVHAGDIGDPSVLFELGRVAPVHAVRGNMDWGTWSEAIPAAEVVAAGRVRIYVLHDNQKLDLDPTAAGMSAVISGHTHRPSVAELGGILYINPGSASQPRQYRKPTVALLSVDEVRLDARIVELPPK
jgi:putative phosphoesterase